MPGSRIVVGTFLDEDALLRAARDARARGVPVHDAFTPYPIHGLDEAAGIPPTRLGIVCFVGAALGLAAAFAMQLYTSAVSWPTNVGGKSFTATPALVPVAFEVMVLFAALGTVGALLVRAKLWPGRKPFLPASGVTDDAFVLALEAETDASATVTPAELLREHAARHVQEVEVE